MKTWSLTFQWLKEKKSVSASEKLNSKMLTFKKKISLSEMPFSVQKKKSSNTNILINTNYILPNLYILDCTIGFIGVTLGEPI